jgi:ribosomal protein S18 acetylase RimI-like enzyme
LVPIDKLAVSGLAERIVSLEPWRTLGTDPTKLAASLAEERHGLIQRAIIRNADIVGVVCVRYPWLFGPYLMLLAVFPECQRSGVGSGILQWLESEVQGSTTNIWACVSSFNVHAQSFYARHGFQEVGVLPDLVRIGFSEILVRKQLGKPSVR